MKRTQAGPVPPGIFLARSLFDRGQRKSVPMYLPNLFNIQFIKERAAKSRKFDRATRDIIRHRETSRFQVVVEGKLQMTEENGLNVCVGT
jgi:hypothetical protein